MHTPVRTTTLHLACLLRDGPNQSRPPEGSGWRRRCNQIHQDRRLVSRRRNPRDLTGRLRRIRASGSTSAEAEAAVRQKAASLGLSPDVVPRASTLGELLELWLAEVVSSRNIRPQTALMYRTKANRLTRLYGGIEVSALRPRRMQVIGNDLAKQMKAPEFQSLKGVLNQALRYAVRAELLPSNPLAALEPVRLAR